jgi:23S rRNA pseudouridine1911/1915/1917 synthase
MSGTARRGKHAITHWRVVCRFKGISLMKISLETGRTHQIRVHLSEAGHPLVGDSVYGGTGRLACISDPVLRKLIKDLGRQALHAGVLGIVHPSTGKYMEFEAPVPVDMTRIIQYLEGTGHQLGPA